MEAVSSETVLSCLFILQNMRRTAVSMNECWLFIERAKGGVAMIVLDSPCLDYPALYKGKNELRIDEPSYVEGIQRLLKIIHDEGGEPRLSCI